jgi:putative transposase
MVTLAAGREAVAHLRGGFAMSERRACRVVAVDRSSMRYRRRRGDDDALRERLKALAEERWRFGYRRLWVLLRRERPHRQPQAALPAVQARAVDGAPTR